MQIPCKIKMNIKNITFYEKFILQTKTVSDGGVEQNRELGKINT